MCIRDRFESERFKEYLKTMSKFYNYSFNNTLLIAMQKPDATLIAGYTAWQRLSLIHISSLSARANLSCLQRTATTLYASCPNRSLLLP